MGFYFKCWICFYVKAFVFVAFVRGHMCSINICIEFKTFYGRKCRNSLLCSRWLMVVIFFSEVAWRLQFVSKGVCVSPDRPGTLSKRKVCRPFRSLRFFDAHLFIDAHAGILRIAAVHHLPFHMLQCASTFSTVAIQFYSKLKMLCVFSSFT